MCNILNFLLILSKNSTILVTKNANGLFRGEMGTYIAKMARRCQIYANDAHLWVEKLFMDFYV